VKKDQPQSVMIVHYGNACDLVQRRHRKCMVDEQDRSAVKDGGGRQPDSAAASME